MTPPNSDASQTLVKAPTRIKRHPLPIPTLRGQLPAAAHPPPKHPLPPGSPPWPAHPPLSQPLTFSTATPPRERLNCRSSSPAPGSGLLASDWPWLTPAEFSLVKTDARHSVSRLRDEPTLQSLPLVNSDERFLNGPSPRSSLQSLLANSYCQSCKEGCSSEGEEIQEVGILNSAHHPLRARRGGLEESWVLLLGCGSCGSCEFFA